MEPDYTVQDLEYGGLLKLADKVVGALAMLGLPLDEIDHDAILAAARRSDAGADWGDQRFLEPMRRLLGVAAAAPTTHLARMSLRQASLTALSNRSALQRHLARHPEVHDEPVSRPLFILGFPRSGTTMLQNLLTLDGSARALRFWELTAPVPLHDDPARDRRARISRARWMMRVAYLFAPEMKQVHHIRWDSLEECWYLFADSFSVFNQDIASGLSEYGDWLLGSDMTWPYQEYRQYLQVLAAQGPTERPRFVLKCPEHLWFLDALLRVFPDAGVVWTHRDPVASIASYCSLISLSRRMMFGRIDPHQVGRSVTERFDVGLQRAMAARDAADPSRFLDVDFAALSRDPIAVVRQIRDQFGLAHPQGSEDGMRRWLQSDREDSRGAHVYGAGQWGLDAEAIRRQYAPYIDRFGVP